MFLAVAPTAIALGFAPMLMTANALSGGPSIEWSDVIRFLLRFWATHSIEIGAVFLLNALCASWLAERIFPTRNGT